MTLPRSTAGRVAALLGGALALLLVATQLFLPGIGEGAIEDRLTENGGVAKVSLSATPAARLLWGDGDSLAIDGTGLELELDVADDPVVFDDLDRFGDVEVAISDSEAGPFAVNSFLLTRSGDEPYTLKTESSTSASDLARFGVASADLPGSGFVGAILDLTGVGGQDLPIELDMTLESDEGRLRVVDGGGEIAGIPTGPLAELITTAIVIRL
jgi:hypothetical protein